MTLSFASCTQSQTAKPTDLSPEPSEDDVVYVCEELPEQEMINLAQWYMLPQTFYIGCMDEETECEIVTKTPQNTDILPTVKLPEVKQKEILLFSSDSEAINFTDCWLVVAVVTMVTGNFQSYCQ